MNLVNICEQSASYRISLEFRFHLVKKSFKVRESEIFIEISKKMNSVWELKLEGKETGKKDEGK